MTMPIFISHWAEHDNSLFEIGESKSFDSEAQAQNYINTWRSYAAYAASKINMISGFVVIKLLLVDFYQDESGKLSINSRFIDL